MSEPTVCAFSGCQAGDILPGAPVMIELRVAHNGVIFGVDEYHPGCWDAELRRTNTPQGSELAHTGDRGGPVG